MNDYIDGIIEEIKHYLNDNTYPYAVLLDGSWGIGKTHFVKNELMKALSEPDDTNNSLIVKYISIYGCSSKDDIRTTILETILSDYIDTVIDNTQSKDLYGQKKADQARYIKKGLSFVGRSVSFFLAQKGISLEKSTVLNDLICLSNYFLIIDDVERCTCPVDETLGILNELVEHDAVKILLIANEREIMNAAATDNSNEALEYLVAANKDIEVEIPQSKNSIISPPGNTTEKSFSIGCLKQRASSIFSSQPQRNYYDVIKEKLIGHTIRFQPDLSTTMHLIIQDTVGYSSALKDIMNNQVKNYCSYFEHYQHPNFRTFQFFISKAVFLYNHCSKMKLQEQNKRSILEAMIMQCFISCLTFKARLDKLETSLWNDMAYPLNIEISFITDFVEGGIYNKQIAKMDLQHYADTHFNTVIPNDDPLLQLRDSYYLNKEEWVLDKYSEMMDRLRDNSYPTSFYTLILQVTCNLIHIGFDETWYSEVEQQMKLLIRERNLSDVITSSTTYSSKTDEYKKINKTIDALNEMIRTNASNGRTKTLKVVLESKDWVEELERYAIKEQRNSYSTTLFSRLPAETWVNRILESTPDEIYRFRSLVRIIYPSNCVSIQLEKDADSITGMSELLKTWIEGEQVRDKILRQNINWLINDFTKLCTTVDEYNQSYQK